MSHTVHAQQTRTDPRRVVATSGARLFAAYWSCLAVVGLTRAAPGPLRLGVLVLLVAACSLHQSVVTAGAIGVVGWLFVDGFVSHAHGVLAIDGPADAVRLALLVAVALAAGRGSHRTRRRAPEEGAR